MSRTLQLICVLIATAHLGSPRSAAADRDPLPASISLPDGFQPEGIAVGRGATIYAGSLATGAIYAANLVTGAGRLLVQPQAGRAAVGLDFDPRTSLLYVAGGQTGAAQVYDSVTGAMVASYQLTTDPGTFVNDQIVTRDAVYFTDTRLPVVYRLALGRDGRPRPSDAVTTIQLGGDYLHLPGLPNGNGIVASRDGRTLIIVHTFLGVLYRVDVETGYATEIDLDGASVFAGDGLLLRGDRLYVVQNTLNQISVIDLDRHCARGELERVIADDRLDIPTTIDDFAGGLYVVNARFTTTPLPDTRYTIERVAR